MSPSFQGQPSRAKSRATASNAFKPYSNIAMKDGCKICGEGTRRSSGNNAFALIANTRGDKPEKSQAIKRKWQGEASLLTWTNLGHKRKLGEFSLTLFIDELGAAMINFCLMIQIEINPQGPTHALIYPSAAPGSLSIEPCFCCCQQCKQTLQSSPQPTRGAVGWAVNWELQCCQSVIKMHTPVQHSHPPFHLSAVGWGRSAKQMKQQLDLGAPQTIQRDSKDQKGGRMVLVLLSRVYTGSSIKLWEPTDPALSDTTLTIGFPLSPCQRENCLCKEAFCFILFWHDMLIEKCMCRHCIYIRDRWWCLWCPSESPVLMILLDQSELRSMVMPPLKVTC